LPPRSESAQLPDIASVIDHALLDPRQGHQAIEQCCKEALHYGFAGVCLASRWMPLARRLLGDRGGNKTKLVSVVGFPFGAVAGSIKRMEAELATEAGADELDLVPDFALLIDAELTTLHDEIAAIVELGLPVKLILEANQLSHQDLEALVEVALDAGVTYLKTGSGYGPAVEPALITLLQQLAGGKAKLKASGGIRNLEQALALVAAGAHRLGTSRGVALVEEQRA
jgi:deoxyribose-phosphate aldolase